MSFQCVMCVARRGEAGGGGARGAGGGGGRRWMRARVTAFLSLVQKRRFRGFHSFLGSLGRSRGGLACASATGSSEQLLIKRCERYKRAQPYTHMGMCADELAHSYVRACLSV
jgi:hypothetical protein